MVYLSDIWELLACVVPSSGVSAGYGVSPALKLLVEFPSRSGSDEETDGADGFRRHFNTGVKSVDTGNSSCTQFISHQTIVYQTHLQTNAVLLVPSTESQAPPGTASDSDSSSHSPEDVCRFSSARHTHCPATAETRTHTANHKHTTEALISLSDKYSYLHDVSPKHTNKSQVVIH